MLYSPSEAFHFVRSYFSTAPSYAILFVTGMCNARCRHCFYLEEIRSADRTKELTLEEIEKIAGSLRLIYLSIGGGEPFIRTDLPEIVHAFYARSGLLYCNIVTNGWYTSRTINVVKTVLRDCPRLRLKIQVSIDDFEHAHDENRGIPGSYRKAVETIRALSELRGRQRRLTLDIATCLTNLNKKNAQTLADRLRQDLVFDNFSFLYPRGNTQDAATKEVSAEEYSHAVEHIEKTDFRNNHNPILGAVQRVARRGLLRVIRENAHPWPCLAGRKFIHITERGVLKPCEVLGQMLPHYDSDLAELRRHDFNVADALATPKTRDVVGFIDESRCRCTFECAAMNNVVFRKRFAVRVLWAWLTGQSN